MFYKIIEFIKFNIWYFIIRPLKKIYNFLFRHAYLPDNERNQALFSYCSKIIDDPTYQPSTPVEHWCDKEWEEMYNEIVERTIEEAKKVVDDEEEIRAHIVPYNEYRQTIASEVLITLSEYAMIKDR